MAPMSQTYLSPSLQSNWQKWLLVPRGKPWVRLAWWVPQDPLGLLGTQANRDPMGILALRVCLASWELWVRLATRGPKVSAVLW